MALDGCLGVAVYRGSERIDLVVEEVAEAQRAGEAERSRELVGEVEGDHAAVAHGGRARTSSPFGAPRRRARRLAFWLWRCPLTRCPAPAILPSFRQEGLTGLLDRSSVPLPVPHRTGEDRVQAIAALRRLRMTGAEIAIVLGMPLSTVSAVLARIGLGKLSRLEPPKRPNRYERARPGELIHV